MLSEHPSGIIKIYAMKKLLFTLMLTLPLTVMAQPNHQKKGKMSPEQQAVLKAKAMRLHLDLTQTQEGKIKNVLQNQMQKMETHRKKAREDKMSVYDRKLYHLENLLALQEQIKSILSAEQYETWKKTRVHKKRMAMRHRRSGKGKNPAMKKEAPPRKRR